MIRFRTPDEFVLNAPLIDQSNASLTYEAVGATRDEMPSGFQHDELTIVIGKGRKLFDECASYIDNWNLQRSMGFVVFPKDSTVSDGVTIMLALPIFGASFVASCRVVYTVREPTRHGFAYGTLPMHPECGEEYFGVTVDSDDTVKFEIRAFSRPHSRLARLGGPITRQLQLKSLHRYAREIEKFAGNV